MARWLALLLSAVLVQPGLGAQTRADASADSTFYAVSYVEAAASSAGTAGAALKQYRDASRKHDGYMGVELFEQTGRPGHFAVVETWRDQKAFDAHVAAMQRPLRDVLQPIRVSDYDQRPYKTLTVGSPAATPNRQAVYVIAHVDVTPNPQVPVMLKQVAEASRREDGNARFDVLQHTMRANHFTVIEAWQSQKALDAHVAATHTKQYRDELQPFTGSPLDERTYKSVE